LEDANSQLEEANIQLLKEVIERELAERSLEKRILFEKKLQNISGAFVKMSSFKEAVLIALENLSELTGSQSSKVIMCSKEMSAHLRVLYTIKNDSIGSSYPENIKMLSEVIKTSTVYYTDNRSDIDDLYSFNNSDILSLVLIPLNIEGVLTAFIELDNVDNVVEWTSDEMKNLETASLIIAMAFERESIEQHFRQSQKLESIGILAAGIAHEINTPAQYVKDNVIFLKESFEQITIILNKYQSLLEDVKNKSIHSRRVEEIEIAKEDAEFDYLMEETPLAINEAGVGVSRIANIVRAVKNFSHPGVVAKTKVDVNESIRSSVAVAKNEWKYVAEVILTLDPDLYLIDGYASEFNQVILNLIINAAHAISDNMYAKNSAALGTIDIITKNKDDSVNIIIRDTGIGIPDNIKDKVFDPFFTTKNVGKGTGQGLAISHNVITKHNGSIFFDSIHGEGTTFTIKLPKGEL